ncbi:agmatinase [Desulfoplanes sp.]
MYNNFLDLDGQNGRHIHVWPVPYEGTVSFMSGTKSGPEAILRASYQIETYDGQLDVDLADLAHFSTLPFVQAPASGPESLHAAMRTVLKNYDAHGDFFVTMGGEHSISLPLFEFYHTAHPDLVILQIDAHSDLRNEYENTPLSHACIMARARELGIPAVQLGIRSLCREEAEYIRSQPPSGLMTIFAWDLDTPYRTAQKINTFLAGRPVYVSFDIDGLDPSLVPGTGTPEPGGISFDWIWEFFAHLWPGSPLVGLDMCEVAPVPGSVVSESVAVKCIVRMLNAFLAQHKKDMTQDP